MASSTVGIPSLPDLGTLSPVPSAAGSSVTGIPGLPGTTADTSTSSSDSSLADDIAAGGTGLPSAGGVGSLLGATSAASAVTGISQSSIVSFFRSIALGGTFALIGLLLIIFSLYVLVTKSGAGQTAIGHAKKLMVAE